MSSSVSFARDSAEPPTVPSNTRRFFSCTVQGERLAPVQDRLTAQMHGPRILKACQQGEPPQTRDAVVVLH